MGYREYVETHITKPLETVGDIKDIYLGKGFYIKCEVFDVRYHDLAKVWIVKLRPVKGAKKFTYYSK